MKTRNNSLKILILLLVIGGVSACEDYLDINTDPNNPTEAPIAALMVNTTFETAQNTFRMGDITSYFVQYLASPNPGSATDVMEHVSHGNTWFNLYNVMTDLSDMIVKAEETEAYHYMGVGQILMALNLAMTVDAFGDVPYSEALDFSTITPTYDDDQALYEEVFRLLDAGLANLSGETSASPGEDDFIYEGDIEKWIKLGNMLRARYLNHLSGTGFYDPASILQAVDNGFVSNEDDAQVIYFAEQFNPWAQVAIDNDNLFLNGWISQQFIEATDGTTHGVVDPRLPLMVAATTDGEYIGVENGAGRGNAPEKGARSVLYPGMFYTSEQSPLLIATYAEQKFIEAEAAFDVDRTRSYQAYLAGIAAHMDKLDVPQAQKNEYLNHPEVAMGEAAFTMDDIFREKYIVMFLHPEAWVDARRYDYAYEDFTLPANLNPDLNNQFIRRLGYPDSEVSRNGRNVPQVSLLDRIFWDEN